jgi:hypothetical protein
MNTPDYTKYALLNIDALHDGDGWYWNDLRYIERGIYIADDSKLLSSNRALLKYMRDNLGVLSEYSKGRVSVEREYDNEIITVCDKSNRQPLVALSCVHGY